MDDKSFSIGDYYSNNTLIGKGSFARVYKGYQNRTNQVVAIKVIELDRLTDDSHRLKYYLESEIKIMKSIKNENILQLIDVHTKENEIYMILEFCSGGDLSEFLNKQVGHRLSENKTCYYMRQLANGLRALREKNIVHRDLKPQNLLLFTPEESPHQLKISDFGFAKFIEPQSVVETLCGSPLYMAPEILRQRKYTIKADLWSVGVIMFEMLTGSPLYKAKNIYELMHLTETTPIALPQQFIGVLSAPCEDLLFSLLQKDPAKRITWEAFFKHPWIGLTEPINVKTSSPSESLPNLSPPSPELFRFDSPPKSTSKLTKPRINPFKAHLDDSSSSRSPAQSPSSSASYYDEQKLFEEVEESTKRALSIADLAEIKLSEECHADAFVLYIKSLSMLNNLVNLPKRKSLTQSTLESSRYSSAMAQATEAFEKFISKAENLKDYLNPNEPTTPPEKLIYEYSLQIGRNAAVDEMISSNYEKSEKQYRMGLLLLQSLLVECREESDKRIVQEYVNLFHKRMSDVSSRT